MLALEAMQPGIHPAAREQRCMRAFFHDTALLNDHDAIARFNG